MALKNPFKLEKLKVHAYEKQARSNKIGTFEAMFNPASVSMKHANIFQKLQELGRVDELLNTE